MALMCECCSMSVDWWGQTALACRSADLPICHAGLKGQRDEQLHQRSQPLTPTGLPCAQWPRSGFWRAVPIYWVPAAWPMKPARRPRCP